MTKLEFGLLKSAAETAKTKVDSLIILYAYTFNPLPHLLFRHPRPHLGGGMPPPACLPPKCHNAPQQSERKVWDILNVTILIVSL